MWFASIGVGRVVTVHSLKNLGEANEMRSSIVVALVVSICALNPAWGDVTWMTQLLTEWNFECSAGTSLKTMQSYQVFQNHDRLWNFTCGGTDAKLTNATCEWSAYANDFNTQFLFQCPNDGVIAGMASYHNNYDRRYQFLCCFPTGYIAHACQFTPNVNSLGVFMSYRRPDNWYIRGVGSEWDRASNGYYDRVFSFSLCKLDKLVPSNCSV
ncbi:unnamed protein product [Lymnaea stagnalis]|uniref:Dermatopontin n=1 Tax=Lymnaea stagnalis TaxID=6523 RepID=A0AAV2I4Z6_LYMST